MTNEAHWPGPVRLEGADVILEPLALAHAPALSQASADGKLWRLWYTSVPKPQDMETAITARLDAAAAGTAVPFAVISKASGDAVGMTSYIHIVPVVKRLEIGTTWYAKSVQRTGLNTQCKLLLLAHAFETLGCIAVELRTHSFNQQSRRAIERLGAKLDGILRNHFDPFGNVRDTCVYSIIAGEWPQVKKHLDFLLSREA